MPIHLVLAIGQATSHRVEGRKHDTTISLWWWSVPDDAAHRQRVGQISDFTAEQEWADVTQRERDLVAGHGDLRYAGFLSVTAPDLDSLQAARAAIEQAAVQAGCETRLLVGQQAQAFVAAALPLCRGI